LGNGRRPQLFVQMEDDLNFQENGRRPQIVGKWKYLEDRRIKWQAIKILVRTENRL
jgi:hypothetical protein